MHPLIPAIVERLRGIGGLDAIALGGSRARGSHTPASDIDIGLYYDPAAGLDLAALAAATAELDDQHREDLLTEPGGWGPWINGGGWLRIHGTPVDFIYRDRAQVAAVINECREGRITLDYQPGHPFAFVSSIYLAETAVCQPLHDPRGQLATLKALANPYPPALQRALIDRLWWETDFSVRIANKGVSRGDSAYVAGSCYRGVACLLMSLFALNRQHWLNEKGALALAAQFPIAPPYLQSRVGAVFAQIDESPGALAAAVSLLDSLIRDTEPLVADWREGD
ncbi:MAG TPA: nucleotidyltransferase domain-containing protein [Herpetosiphonaceae bacterium]